MSTGSGTVTVALRRNRVITRSAIYLREFGERGVISASWCQDDHSHGPCLSLCRPDSANRESTHRTGRQSGPAESDNAGSFHSHCCNSHLAVKLHDRVAHKYQDTTYFKNMTMGRVESSESSSCQISGAP
jgi:hypothetical protein